MSQVNKRPYRPAQRSAPRSGQPQGAAPSSQARPARPQSPAARRRRSGAFRGTSRLLVGGLTAVVLAYGLQCLWPDGFPLTKKDTGAASVEPIAEIHSGGPIRINEVMSANQSVLSISDGSTPDWIEVANIGKNPVNLSGYSLSEEANAVMVFHFPELWLEPGECVLVYADSRLREDAGEDLHAPFRLSSAGDTLMLFNESGTAIDTVNLPAMAQNLSYARVDSAAWETSDMPTPGMLNGEENYRALNEKRSDSPVVVSELMSTNASVLPDENGQYYDYIELYNRSGEAVDLSGWYLSDDASTARKWRFPDVRLEAGQYLVVFASGLDRKDDPTHLHTNFSLSSEGEQVALSNAQGQLMDCVDFDLLGDDVAWSLSADGSWTDAKQPSPGSSNP